MKSLDILKMISSFAICILILVDNLTEPLTWLRGIAMGLAALALLLNIVLLVAEIRRKRGS